VLLLELGLEATDLHVELLLLLNRKLEEDLLFLQGVFLVHELLLGVTVLPPESVVLFLQLLDVLHRIDTILGLLDLVFELVDLGLSAADLLLELVKFTLVGLLLLAKVEIQVLAFSV